MATDALPEAYERLLLDAMQGDAALFARADEIELAWGIVDPILASWQEPDAAPLAMYEPGSWGPVEADELTGPARPSLDPGLRGALAMNARSDGRQMAVHWRGAEQNGC